MAFNQTVYRRLFGKGWHPKGDQIEKLLTYREIAGSPVGTIAPDHVGQEAFDTTGRRFFRAVGLSDQDWQQTTGVEA